MKLKHSDWWTSGGDIAVYWAVGYGLFALLVMFVCYSEGVFDAR